jgi:uncharacterized protein (DUF305 family)
MRLPVTLAAAAVLLLAGCGTQPDPKPAAAPPAAAAAEAPNAASTAIGTDFNDTDVMFLQMLGAHHTQGVAIVKLAGERSSREDVKMLAKAIEVTQTDEIARISGWLKQWQKPATAPADAHAEHGGERSTSEQEIKALSQAKGADFDRRFLDTLIAHQDDAVQLARMETTGGKNEQVKSYAKQVDDSRSAQIKQMLTYKNG